MREMKKKGRKVKKNIKIFGAKVETCWASSSEEETNWVLKRLNDDFKNVDDYDGFPAYSHL